jgi:carbonic anhydrase/acetyltransferase-like protein (isoleucine patch superfamily)
VVLNGAVIGKGCLIGANALVTEGADSRWLGGVRLPGKVRKTLSAEEQLMLAHNADHYVGNAARYLRELEVVE